MIETAVRRRSPVRATRSGADEWRAPGIYPTSNSATELAHRAASDPGRPAVIDAHSGAVHDFAALAADVRRLAGALSSRGVGVGDVVGMQLPNWYETVVVVHAAAHIGAVVCPIVPIYREREVSFILAEARPAILFVPHIFRGFDHVSLAQRCAAGPDMTIVVVGPPNDGQPPGCERFTDLLAEDRTAEPAGAVDDIAAVIYTSGTTSNPKGALHSHQTLGYEVRTIVDLFSLTAADAVFMPSPLTHITGLLFGAIMPAITGCSVTLLDVWDPVTAVDAVERDRCAFVMAATPFLRGMADDYERRVTSSSLRVFVCGGADVPPALIRRASDLLGAHVARVYGSSEFPTLTCGGPEDDIEVRAETDGMLIGPVLARIDGAAPDGVGELVVDGPELFLGYLDPELNTAAFTADGLFRTGDLAVLEPSGAITLRGRLKDIIIRGGENISAREVEDLLLLHPAVDRVAVVAMPDPVLVERVCAFVVVRPGAKSPTVAELGGFLSDRGLARQKHPERVEIVDDLPLTASGKVQKFLLRGALRSLLESGQSLVME